MGRSKITFKRIPNDRARKATFMRRRKGLMKKVSEFSTVCGVEACLIVYDENGDAMTWPQDPIKAHSIIDKYEHQKNEKPCKTFDLEDFSKNRKNMVEAEISRVKRDILKIKYPTWHPSFNNLGEEQLEAFISVLDAKLGACDERIEMLKKEHQTEANLSFIQNVSESQLIPARMKAVNDNNGNIISMLGAKNEAYNQRIGMVQNQTQSQLLHAPMNALNDNNNNRNIISMLGAGAGSQRIEMSQNDNQSEDFSFIQNMIQESIASDQSQLNFMQNYFQNQLITAPMKPLNNHYGMMDSTNQLGGPVDWARQLDELHHLTSLLGESQNGQQSAALPPLPPSMDEFQTMLGFPTT